MNVVNSIVLSLCLVGSNVLSVLLIFGAVLECLLLLLVSKVKKMAKARVKLMVMAVLESAERAHQPHNLK